MRSSIAGERGAEDASRTRATRPSASRLGKVTSTARRPREDRRQLLERPGAETDGDRVVVADATRVLFLGPALAAGTGQGARLATIDQILLFADSPFEKSYSGD